MKGILIGITIFILTSLTSMLLASCEHKCNASTLQAYCPSKSVETPMVEFDGHLWKAIMLEHSPDCGCDEDREFEWPEYESSDYELGN